MKWIIDEQPKKDGYYIVWTNDSVDRFYFNDGAWWWDSAMYDLVDEVIKRWLDESPELSQPELNETSIIDFDDANYFYRLGRFETKEGQFEKHYEKYLSMIPQPELKAVKTAEDYYKETIGENRKHQLYAAVFNYNDMIAFAKGFANQFSQPKEGVDPFEFIEWFNLFSRFHKNNDGCWQEYSAGQPKGKPLTNDQMIKKFLTEKQKP